MPHLPGVLLRAAIVVALLLGGAARLRAETAGITGYYQPDEFPPSKGAARPRAETAGTTAVKGTVVDAGARPVPKAVVEARRGLDSRKTTTDEKGRFELKLPRPWLGGLLLVASQNNGEEQAFRRSDSEADWEKQPLRLQLKPARRIAVRVVDEGGKPVATARVGVLAEDARFGATTTDAVGKASCLVPTAAAVQAVYAWKGGAGLDYRAYRAPRRRGPAQPAAPVLLTLDGARTVRVRVLDTDGKPIARLQLYPWYLEKPSEFYAINLSGLGGEFLTKTDEKGVAVFAWVPLWERRLITFWPVTETHARHRATYDPRRGDGTLTMKLDRLVPLRGRVVLPDGKPAAGIRILAEGKGYSVDGFQGEARTDAAGRWQLQAVPHMIYLVVVDDNKWSAPPRTGFAVLPDRPLTGVDFQLRPATRVHGVATGSDRKPAAGRWVSVYQYGKSLHSLKGVNLPNPENSRSVVQPIVVRNATTDGDGRYEVSLGPGEYDIRSPYQREVKKFTIRDEKALVFDFHDRRVALAGLVVAGNPPTPVAGARVSGIYWEARGGRELIAKADKDGKFEITRQPSLAVLCARSADNRLAAVVEVPAAARTVTIAVRPVGSARGRVLDEAGKPMSGQEIVYGLRIFGNKGGGLRSAFFGTTHTDMEGRVSLSGLVVGQLYDVSVTLEGGHRAVGQVKPQDARPIDLGDLTLRPLYRPPTLAQRTAAAFQSKLSPRERFAAAVRDARLSRQHVLLVLADADSPATRHLFQLRFDDREVRRALDPYRIVPVPLGDKALPAAGELAKHLKVSLAKRSFPLLLVYDNEEVQVALSEAQPLTKGGRIDRAALLRFLKAHAPQTLDAKKLLADALAQAKKEKKRILVQETATWCPPCWALSRFLDRHREVWSKDYLWVKIDHRWTHAIEVMKGIRKGAQGGIPWTAILDADGKVLATSNDGEGNNVGFPGTPSGIDHFVAMIRKTAIRLTEADLARLRKALGTR